MAKPIRGSKFFDPLGLPVAVLPFGDVAPLRRPYPYAHSHDFSELFIIVGGQGVHVAEGREYPVSAGDVFFLQPGQAHYLKDTTASRGYCVMFDSTRLPLPSSELRKLPGYQAVFVLEPRHRRRHEFNSRLRLRRKQLADVERLVKAMHREGAQKAPGYSAVLLGQLLELIVLLARRYAAIEAKEGQSLLLLGGILGELESECARPWRLEEIVRRSGMSGSYLSRVFRKATGYTPIDYLIQMRVQKAMELLRTTTWSVTEIAERVGFTSANYFARRFRTATGVSPRDYRKSTH
jgi:AraC-like DNA-binding protein